MEKFLKFVYFLFSFLFFGYCTIVWVLVVIYEPPLRHPIGGFLAIFFFGGMTLLFFSLLKDVFKKTDNPEETPKEKTKTENLKTDNPEDNEIITVTEIKGERNIIIDVVVKIIVFIIGLVLTGFLTSFLRYLGLSGVIITILGLLPLILAIKYCFTTNDKDKDKE